MRNTNRYIGGGSWAHVFDGPGTPLVYLTVYGGSEPAKNELREDFGRDLIGVRAGGQYVIKPQWTATGSVVYQHSEYDAADPFFGIEREDDYFEIAAAVRYDYRSNIEIKPEIRYSNNSSDLGLSEYDRFQFITTATYRF